MSDRKYISVPMKPNFYKAVKELAKKEDMPLALLIRKLLKDAIQESGLPYEVRAN